MQKPDSKISNSVGNIIMIMWHLQRPGRNFNGAVQCFTGHVGLYIASFLLFWLTFFYHIDFWLTLVKTCGFLSYFRESNLSDSLSLKNEVFWLTFVIKYEISSNHVNDIWQTFVKTCCFLSPDHFLSKHFRKTMLIIIIISY